MINVTSQYSTQTFLPVAKTQIIAQNNTINSTNISIPLFPKTYTRTSSAGTAPDGSGAAMYQVDSLIQQSTYAFNNTTSAQEGTIEAAAYNGNEYYIELSPLNNQYYQILTWQSNL